MTTAAVVAYYRNEHEALISYAGHPPVLYKRATDEMWSFATPPERETQSKCLPMNLPFDIFPDTEYRQFAIQLEPGDRLFVYTDGITEASNPKGELFGKDRLKNTLDENATIPLSELKLAVLRALHQYTTKKELNHDDITLIALEIY